MSLFFLFLTCSWGNFIIKGSLLFEEVDGGLRVLLLSLLSNNCDVLVFVSVNFVAFVNPSNFVWLVLILSSIVFNAGLNPLFDIVFFRLFWDSE